MEGFILNIAPWKLCPSPFLGDFDQFSFSQLFPQYNSLVLPLCRSRRRKGRGGVIPNKYSKGVIIRWRYYSRDSII